MIPDFTKFEEKTGVSFSDKDLLRQAFTHRSYINENRMLSLEHNERLEFLGDAVLELVTTDYLFAKYTDRPEGELTSYRSALVNSQTLSAVATELGVNDFLLLSHGEARDTGRARQYILADTLEAIIGAIYIDQGYDAAKKFIHDHILHLIDDIVEKRKWIDSKSYLQEKAQDKTGITPSYKTLKESGPDHDKRFTVGVYLGTQLIVSGEGKSKQEAEQNAAQKALEENGWL
jgi:ribonuclease III